MTIKTNPRTPITAISSARILSPEEAQSRISRLHHDYVAREEPFQSGAVEELPFRKFVRQFERYSGRDNPQWMKTMRGDHSVVDATTHAIQLDWQHRSTIERSGRQALNRLEATAAIVTASGKRLRMGSFLTERQGTNLKLIRFLPEAVVSRLLLGGTRILKTRNHMNIVFVDQPVTDVELRNMVANLECPVVLMDLDQETDRVVINGTPGFHPFMRTYADFTTWLGHTCWAKEHRADLIWLHDLLEDPYLPDVPFTKAAQQQILLGPDPSLYGQFREKGGFYGALFYAIAVGPLDGHYRDPEMSNWVRLLLNRIQRDLGRSSDKFKEVRAGFQVLSDRHMIAIQR